MVADLVCCVVPSELLSNNVNMSRHVSIAAYGASGAEGAEGIESYDRLFARAEMTVSDSDGDTVGDKGDSFSQFPMIEPYCFLVVSYNIQNDGGVVTGSFVGLDVMSLDHSPSSDKKREYDRLADEWQEQLRILGPGLEKRITFARAKLRAVQSEL